MLSIRLLGPLEVEFQGESIKIPGVKTRIMLVRLALEVGVPVSSHRLVNALWGENPPTNSANALQAKASELRRVLGSSTGILATRTHC